MDIVVPVLLIVMGMAMAAIWTRDILRGEQVDLSVGLFAARDPEAGTLFWPHWLAEYGTAVLLVVGGVGLLGDAGWAPMVAAIGTGALLYTSTNSLGWALARRERWSYAAPMLAGVVLGIASTVFLLLR
ncbi:MAG: hypothetical protein WCC01_01275 [Acidimicrobiia bacterium]